MPTDEWRTGNASSVKETEAVGAIPGDENAHERRNAEEEKATRESRSKTKSEDNDGSADFMQSEGIEEMQQSINQTMTALMETAGSCSLSG